MVDRAPATPATPTDGQRAVEICGYGPVAVDTDDVGALRQVRALTKADASRWLAALLDSDDLRAREAGLVLKARGMGADSIVLQPVADRARDEAVELAAGSDDPAVYALALSLCGPAADADGGCGRLSLRRWAELDPRNAVPWLLLAGRARARHDVVAEADAFSHAAAARTVDAYGGSLFDFAAAELPPDTTPLQRAYLTNEVVGIGMATAFGPYSSAATHHCSSEAVQDETTRAQCASLAELLVSAGSTLLDLSIAKTIGERVGWPVARVQGLERQQQALMQAVVEEGPADEKSMWTCRSVNQLNAYFKSRERLGELGAAREALTRSGKTVEEMARDYDEHLKAIRREAIQHEARRGAAD